MSNCVISGDTYALALGDAHIIHRSPKHMCVHAMVEVVQEGLLEPVVGHWMHCQVVTHVYTPSHPEMRRVGPPTGPRRLCRIVVRAVAGDPLRPASGATLYIALIEVRLTGHDAAVRARCKS